MFYNNTWGTVCDDMWDLEDANVVCKNMGYPGALSITNSEVFGSGSTNKIVCSLYNKILPNQSQHSIYKMLKYISYNAHVHSTIIIAGLGIFLQC